MQENIKQVIVKNTVRKEFKTAPIFQYDVGHVLSFEGFNLPEAFEVHFSLTEAGDAVIQVGSEGEVAVPDILVQDGRWLYAWLYISDQETGLTKFTIQIPVTRRAKPTDQVPTPVEQSEIQQAIAALNTAVVKSETAAENAEQSEENAYNSSEAAANAAESAEGDARTATEKAQIAVNAAETATRKAQEASESAEGLAEAVRTAQEAKQTAVDKATEAAQSAVNAGKKAQEATSAASSASQSATAAETAKEAAQGYAGNASTSAQAAETAKDTAVQKAGEAGQSATNAAQSAQAAQQTAQQFEEDITELKSDIQAKQDAPAEAGTEGQVLSLDSQGKPVWATPTDAVTRQEFDGLVEDVEDLSNALETHKQEAEETYAKQDGYYSDLTAGNAEQLVSSKLTEDQVPYKLRPAGGTNDIGNREYKESIVGGTIAWNQLVRDEASDNETDYADVVTVTDAVEDAAGVKVKIEPVQDLHGYDHPWPAGGGKNKCDGTAYSCVISSNIAYILNRTPISSPHTTTVDYWGAGFVAPVKAGQAYAMSSDAAGSAVFYWAIYASLEDITDRTKVLQSGSAQVTFTADYDGYVVFMRENHPTGQTVAWTYAQLELGSSATAFAPYSNICPITGWTAAKISRTGKNLLDDSDKTVTASSIGASIEYGKTNGILLKAGSTYTFSLTGVTSAPNGIYIRRLDNKDSVGRAYNANSVTVTVSNDIVAYGYVLYNNGQSADTWASIKAQIELGSTVTDYESYAGQVYDIALPTEAGTVYGGTLDVSTGELVVDMVSIDLGEKIYSKAKQGAAKTIFYTELPNGSRKDSPFGFCSVYKMSTDAAYSVDKTARLYGSSQYNFSRVGIRDSTFDDNDAATFKIAMSGVQLVYELATPITYTLTASQITTLLGTNNVWADTGDVALTYTGTDEHLTLESGKKYLSRISGTDSMLLGSGQEITAVKGTDNVFDLTKMFGTAVADYVYGQGAAFFRKWFPSTRYPYNAGELRHVDGLQSHEMVGFNQWDEEWEIRGSGVYQHLGSKNKIPVIPGAQYFFNAPVQPSNGITYYKSDGVTRTGTTWYNKGNITIPSDAFYMMFGMSNAYGFIYKHDICINLSHNGSRNGEYEPYEKHSYPLDSTVILRGIPKVGANGVYWDGDRYLPDGTVERRYGVVDLGTLNWDKQTLDNIVNFRSEAISQKIVENSQIANIVCEKYSTVSNYAIVRNDVPDKSISLRDVTIAGFRVHDLDFADKTANEFKAAMQGVLLVYELATPTTESANPYRELQIVDDWGTEEFVTTGLVPVGHETQYPANLRDKLQHLPDLASSNGIYIVKQTDSEMELLKLPDMPTANGNYRLKLNVASGSPTFSWEVVT